MKREEGIYDDPQATDRPTHPGWWWNECSDRPVQIAQAHLDNWDAYLRACRPYVRSGRWLPVTPPEFPPAEPELVPCVCGQAPSIEYYVARRGVECECGWVGPRCRAETDAVEVWNALMSAPAKVKDLEAALDKVQANFDDAEKTVAEREMDLDAARDELAKVKQAWPRRFKLIDLGRVVHGAAWADGTAFCGSGTFNLGYYERGGKIDWIDDPPEGEKEASGEG